METAVIRKLGFRIKRKLKTLQAFIPEPHLDDIEWKNRITASDTLTQLDQLLRKARSSNRYKASFLNKRTKFCAWRGKQQDTSLICSAPA